nr:unnamed protein product [Callosobruchus analis]
MQIAETTRATPPLMPTCCQPFK